MRLRTLGAIDIAATLLASQLVATRRHVRRTPSSEPGRSVKIGCLVPLTGKGAEWGQAAKPSMDIAVEEINAKGGIGGLPIELICYDTPDARSRSAQGDQPPGRARQGAG